MANALALFHLPTADGVGCYSLKGGKEWGNVTGSDYHVKEAALRGVIALSVNPTTLAKSGTETGEQRALFCWLNYMSQWFPDLEYAFAVPNGGSRGDTEQSRKIAGGAIKAEGGKAGVPDLMVPIPRLHVGTNCLYAGLFIEMKKLDGGDGGSKEQHTYNQFLNRMHYKAVFCNGWKEAVAEIRKYLEI